MKKISVAVLILLIVLGCVNSNNTMTKEKKTIIAHRGASGYLPEHTLPAKAMAFAMEPDFIEQDVVLSKDGVPIVIHDIHLETTTDVADKFPERQREDGRFYVIDFTFEELKELLVSERIDGKTGEQVFPDRFPKGKSRFGLHSLSEEIELIQGLEKSTGKKMGIYPEIKNPAFHKEEGKDISKAVLNVLSHYGYTTKKDNCILQCFDAQELKRIRTELKSDLFLVQLMEFPGEIQQIEKYAQYADGLGPWIQLLEDTELMKRAKALDLTVHAYTLRKDQLNGRTNFEALLNKVFYEQGVDGVFTDHPDTVLELINTKG